ncbi:MAG: hypothetical protein GY940_06335, partial [bacterium]|nr:hypothetical protein [bacterium]
MIKRLILFIIIITGLILSAPFGILFAAGQESAGAKPPDHLAKKLRYGFQSVGKSLYDGGTLLRAKEKIKLTRRQEQKIEMIMMNYREFAILKSAEIKIRELRLA